MSAMLAREGVLKEVYNYTDKVCAPVCACREHMENTTVFHFFSVCHFFFFFCYVLSFLLIFSKFFSRPRRRVKIEFLGVGGQRGGGSRNGPFEVSRLPPDLSEATRKLLLPHSLKSLLSLHSGFGTFCEFVRK